MGFKEIFQRNLQAEQQQQSSAAASEEQQAAARRSKLLGEVEPKLRMLVNDIYESVQAAGLPRMHVTDGSPNAVTGLSAYAVGWYSVDRRTVIDSSGQIAFRQFVRLGSDRKTPLSCDRLDQDYERELAKVMRAETRRDECIHVNDVGVLMFSRAAGVVMDNTVYETLPLEEYLANEAAKMIAGTYRT